MGTVMETNTRKRVARILLAMGLSLAGASLHAQENRKALNSPTPTYPETARQFRVSGVGKVQVVIAPDGQIKDVKVIGGHPLLVNSVQETLKNWKYAPASSETTATLVFNFHP
jgi:TonB family protein